MREAATSIYIVLSYTGTKVARIIRHITKTKYAHAALSLDDKLDAMYSFARKGTHNHLTILAFSMVIGQV